MGFEPHDREVPMTFRVASHWQGRHYLPLWFLHLTDWSLCPYWLPLASARGLGDPYRDLAEVTKSTSITPAIIPIASTSNRVGVQMLLLQPWATTSTLTHLMFAVATRIKAAFSLGGFYPLRGISKAFKCFLVAACNEISVLAFNFVFQ